MFHPGALSVWSIAPFKGADFNMLFYQRVHTHCITSIELVYLNELGFKQPPILETSGNDIPLTSPNVVLVSADCAADVKIWNLTRAGRLELVGFVSGSGGEMTGIDASTSTVLTQY